MILKICIIFVLIIFIYFFLKKNERFQNPGPTFAVDLSVEIDDIVPGYDSIFSDNQSTSLDIDSHFPNNSMNINIGNSIIAENKMRINGKHIDINAIRYLKSLPIHYSNEFCLKGEDGKIE